MYGSRNVKLEDLQKLAMIISSYEPTDGTWKRNYLVTIIGSDTQQSGTYCWDVKRQTEILLEKILTDRLCPRLKKIPRLAVCDTDPAISGM
jgi:hypothetical protein